LLHLVACATLKNEEQLRFMQDDNTIRAIVKRIMRHWRAFCARCGTLIMHLREHLGHMQKLLIRFIIGSALIALLSALLLSAPQALRAQNATRTPLPSLTPSPTSPLLAETPTPLSTATSTPSLLRQGVPPPLTVDVPSDWRAGYQVVPVRVALEAYPMNVAVYRGALREGGIGTLIVLWGFPSIAPPPTIPPLLGTPTEPPDLLGDFVSRALYADGLRLLQGAVIDITCNVGTTGRTPLSVAGMASIGTYFSATQCQGEPDTAGWFVGARFNDRNYLFYVYVEPVEAYNAARAQLQEILDSVRFIVPTPTAAP
jgi:hypothetical protein